MTITHKKTATLPDQAGVEVNKAEWNDDHRIIEGGGATLAVGTINDGELLTRTGGSVSSTPLTGAAGPAGATGCPRPTRPNAPGAPGATRPPGGTGNTAPSGP